MIKKFPKGASMGVSKTILEKKSKYISEIGIFKELASKEFTGGA